MIYLSRVDLLFFRYSFHTKMSSKGEQYFGGAALLLFTKNLYSVNSIVIFFIYSGTWKEVST